MGRIARSEQEVLEKKNEILERALSMIEKYGYDGFSIRKLGPKLGMAPKTIYNYFTNKDEIYLHILTRGFELLYENLDRQAGQTKDAFEKLTGLTRAFINFGFEQSNYYDIMFTLYVPKANDYVGTPLEPLAAQELRSALKVADLFISTIEGLDHAKTGTDTRDARTSLIQLLASMHGIVALKNNTILDYLHADSMSIMDDLIQRTLSPFKSH